jgi:DNA polymerase-3 subunit delta'
MWVGRSRNSIEQVLAELERHAHARAVLAPVLRGQAEPSHAYLFHGPGGAGKRSAARALAAELLAAGSPEPDGARARARSGSHPDLTWVVPSGAHEILVSDIDQPVVAAASKTPFEGARRVFVIERVDELGDEAANRMLKTLEEPSGFVHLVLLTDRLTEVLPTISSRCQLVRFDAASLHQVTGELEGLGCGRATAEALARVSLGDPARARALAAPEGVALRAAAEGFARAALEGSGDRDLRPWQDVLAAAKAEGEAVRAELEERGRADVELYPSRERKRVESEWTERIRRARRRAETGALDVALQLVALWYADLAALSWGAEELVRHTDRLAELRADMGSDPHRLTQAVDLVEETRRRFVLNVSEELALEALASRLQRMLGRDG